LHEFGITSRIVEAVARVAEENGASRVVRVDLLIGQLTFLSVHQVKLAYDILVRGTTLEGSELSVMESEGLVQCAECHYEREIRIDLPTGPGNLSGPLPLFSCSKCGGKVVVIKGKECLVTGVALEEE